MNAGFPCTLMQGGWVMFWFIMWSSRMLRYSQRPLQSTCSWWALPKRLNKKDVEDESLGILRSVCWTKLGALINNVALVVIKENDGFENQIIELSYFILEVCLVGLHNIFLSFNISNKPFHIWTPPHYINRHMWCIKCHIPSPYIFFYEKAANASNTFKVNLKFH